MRHTLNKFKDTIRNMTKEEKEQLLADLKLTLMTERSKCAKGGSSMNIRLLRRQIAMVKTELNYKGFHYVPR